MSSLRSEFQIPDLRFQNRYLKFEICNLRSEIVLVPPPLESVSNLNPISERVIPINRVTALLVPGDLSRIRPPVVFLAAEFLQDHRIDGGIDAKIDVRSFDRARAALGNLIDSMQ